MASAFTRTLQSLDTRHGGGPLRIAGALALLAGWVAWMVCARVAVYAASVDARVEVARNAHRVAARDSGRITATLVRLGQRVVEGEVLVELDATVEKRHLDEAAAKVAALGPQVDALRARLGAERDVLVWQWRVDTANIDRAREDLRQADLSAQFDGKLGDIADRLHEEQLASAMDHLKAQKTAMESRAKAGGARVDVNRALVTQRVQEKRSLAQIADLQRQLTEIQAQTIEARAAAETARAELERRTVRAPAAGKVGAVGTLQVGDVLKEGDAIATIVPSEDVHLVAQFAPADAVGRLTVGKRGRARLAGFPWTEFGSLDATITGVASEPQNGTIRVELLLEPASAARIPLQHGMPGSVEVEVERASPWSLLVRSAGLAADSSKATPATATAPAPVASGAP